MGDESDETTKIFFGAEAVDLVSGKQVVSRHGSIGWEKGDPMAEENLFWTVKKGVSKLQG